VPADRKRAAVELAALDGRSYARFLAAGAYFLKKYRTVVNELNVFPVPDGDTGSNMYLTVRSSAQEAYRSRATALSEVATVAAEGALMGARGNSGVILSQMMRGFAHHVRHRTDADTFTVATALREAALAARQSLIKPAEGTILSVADAAADAAYHLALHERDLLRFLSGVLKAANDALDTTPQQLPALAEAGVVDAGGAGFVYLLEGALAFLPEVRVRATAFPRRRIRAEVFTAKQNVGENRFCTEFMLEHATCTIPELKRLLEQRSESLVLAANDSTIKVHVHTDDPERVQALASRHGVLSRVKVDDMERQHSLLLVEERVPVRSIVAVVPGPGFASIARELGTEVTVQADGNPSVRELSLAINKCLSDHVYLFANDENAVGAAREAAARSSRDVVVVPTKDPVEGVSGLVAMGGNARPSQSEIETAIGRTRSAKLFFSAKESRIAGIVVARGAPAAVYRGSLLSGDSMARLASRLVAEMRDGSDRGLVTLYYGGTQREKDAQRLSEEVQAAQPGVDVDYYYGGMNEIEYWLSFDE
jgi:DAK2 domain fusion protein YloV